MRQILANNSYSQTVIDTEIQRILAQHNHTQTERGQKAGETTHTLFYENQMSDAYKTDERILRGIISRNCDPVHQGEKLKLVIYYKTPKVSDLILKNNLSADPSTLKKTNVVYQYKCTHGDCARQHNGSYIGLTTTTLGRRITMHLQDGGPKRHLRDTHNTRLSRQDMVDNTTVLCKCTNRRKLHALEAVYMLQCVHEISEFAKSLVDPRDSTNSRELS